MSYNNNNKINNYKHNNDYQKKENLHKTLAGIVYNNNRYVVLENAIAVLELTAALEDSKNVSIKVLLESLNILIPELYLELKKNGISMEEFGAIASVVAQIAYGDITEDVVLNREFFRTALKGKSGTTK